MNDTLNIPKHKDELGLYQLYVGEQVYKDVVTKQCQTFQRKQDK